MITWQKGCDIKERHGRNDLKPYSSSLFVLQVLLKKSQSTHSTEQSSRAPLQPSLSCHSGSDRHLSFQVIIALGGQKRHSLTSPPSSSLLSQVYRKANTWPPKGKRARESEWGCMWGHKAGYKRNKKEAKKTSRSFKNTKQSLYLHVSLLPGLYSNLRGHGIPDGELAPHLRALVEKD